MFHVAVTCRSRCTAWTSRKGWPGNDTLNWSGRITETVQRLTAAGGRALRDVDGHHVIMADPEGNEFCVC